MLPYFVLPRAGDDLFMVVRGNRPVAGGNHLERSAAERLCAELNAEYCQKPVAA